MTVRSANSLLMFILEAFFNSAVFFFFFSQLSCDSAQSCLHNDVEQHFGLFFLIRFTLLL